MKQFFLIAFVLSFIFYSCSQSIKKVQVMTKSGSIMEVENPNNVEFSKGDTIVIRHFCNHKTNPCETSVYGYYKGTIMETDVVWEGGKIKASYSYEKVVFLKNLTK